jgi:hypothetical protein
MSDSSAARPATDLSEQNQVRNTIPSGSERFPGQRHRAAAPGEPTLAAHGTGAGTDDLAHAGKRSGPAPEKYAGSRTTAARRD